MLDVLVVGPAGRETGGIARYIDDQVHRVSSCSIRVYDVQTPAGEGVAWFLFGVVASVARMLAFPLRRRPDVVHVHTSHRFSFYLSSFYVLFASGVWRRPVVLHVHGSGFDEFVETARGPLRRFQVLVFGRCAAVIVLSPYWVSVLDGVVPNEKLITMPNAVAASEFDPAFSADVPHVVFVSNLIERKGVPELLTALGRLQRDPGVPRFKVTLAGVGPLADDVAEFAASHERVAYRGYVSESEKRSLLEAGTVSVLPSRAEGLPIALLEAMAAGNAVVATTVGSIPEAVDDDNGILVAPGDVDALTAAVRRLLTDHELAEELARNNHDLALESFSWTTHADHLAALYQSVAGRDGPGARADGWESVAAPVRDR